MKENGNLGSEEKFPMGKVGTSRGITGNFASDPKFPAEVKVKGHVMCTATLKQELNQSIDLLPDDSVRLLVEIANRMKPAQPAADESKSAQVPRRKAGVFADRPFYMADDFDETPECFKEYVSVEVPAGMKTYLESPSPEEIFARDAMLLYPHIQDLTISHGRAAEILGISKLDLIDYYCSIGIPYIEQTREELEAEVLSYSQLAGASRC